MWFSNFFLEYQYNYIKFQVIIITDVRVLTWLLSSFSVCWLSSLTLVASPVGRLAKPFLRHLWQKQWFSRCRCPLRNKWVKWDPAPLSLNYFDEYWMTAAQAWKRAGGSVQVVEFLGCKVPAPSIAWLIWAVVSDDKTSKMWRDGVCVQTLREHIGWFLLYWHYRKKTVYAGPGTNWTDPRTRRWSFGTAPCVVLLLAFF